MASAAANASAGEDIRVLARAQAAYLQLPDDDVWLLDSRTLVRFHIDEQDVTTGVEVIDDPADVLAACRARDRAWPLVSPSTEVWTWVRSSARVRTFRAPGPPAETACSVEVRIAVWVLERQAECAFHSPPRTVTAGARSRRPGR
ncbi:DUF6879 family protein [Streptomyces sp. NPDC002602]|uniref:DUF6879 family protein n=1 Tax=Streptomyces sp. NPDC002602 TaxID=3364654 RepID=UPI0036A66523